MVRTDGAWLSLDSSATGSGGGNYELPTPMEIDRVLEWKGKSKGKGKSKHKNGQKFGSTGHCLPFGSRVAGAVRYASLRRS